MLLYERVRPTTLEGVAGHSKLKERLVRLRDQFGWAGQVFWFAGPSGCAKTTIARIMAAELTIPLAVEEYNAARVGCEQVWRWESRCSSRPLGGKQWVIIINEAHNMTHRVVEELQTVLENEEVQRNSTWIFTTTLVGQQELFENKLSAAAFASRAKCYTFKNDDETQEAVVKWVAKVADDFGLNGKPLRAYWQLGQDCKFNVRAMLQFIEGGGMVE